jgi:hypothetical protein
MAIRTMFVVTAALLLWGCGTMKAQDFDGKEPRLRFEEYFAGKTKAWGLFEDRLGNVRRAFTVDLNGRWDGGVFVLEEDFSYDDGEKMRRDWRVTKTGEHTYEGRADDVIGVAKGEAYGNVASWRYVIDLPVGDGKWRVNFDDWMFLQPDGVLLNRAHVSRWGFWIGTVTIAFKRPEPTRAAAE